MPVEDSVAASGTFCHFLHPRHGSLHFSNHCTRSIHTLAPFSIIFLYTFVNTFENFVFNCRLKEVTNIQVSMFADDFVMLTESNNHRYFQIQRQKLENSMNEALEVLQVRAMNNHVIINKSKPT
ncbi:hypothetical protein NPIL_283011 [Nephila pilipes]|uniref:Uncharacterized protein n=1 Tax=Nephila pilipes TaxID=299642 RepID=A0A8X6PPB4_NEPPI|nr:hypothetical protein NPIL_283011 [Nephila pilipes]